MRLVSCCFFLGATGNEVVSFVSFGYRRNKNSQKSFPLSLLQRVLFLEVHLNPAVESHHSIFLQKWQNRDPCLGGNKKEVIFYICMMAGQSVEFFSCSTTSWIYS